MDLGLNGRLAERVAEHGPVDVLVNNVGAVSTRRDGFLAITDHPLI
jgi:hypothetical protein